MLIIRKQQLEALRQAKRDQFRKTAIAHLRSWASVPASDVPDAIPGIIDEGMTAAALYGFLTATHQLAFIESLWVHGPAFYKKEAWAVALLRTDSLSAGEVLSRLRAGVGSGNCIVGN